MHEPMQAAMRRDDFRARPQQQVEGVAEYDLGAKACQFLAEDAGFITGQTLVIDGGMTVKMIYAE